MEYAPGRDMVRAVGEEEGGGEVPGVLEDGGALGLEARWLVLLVWLRV